LREKYFLLRGLAEELLLSLAQAIAKTIGRDDEKDLKLFVAVLIDPEISILFIQPVCF